LRAKGRCEQMPLQSGYPYYDLGTYHCDTPLNGLLPYTVTEAAAGRHTVLAAAAQRRESCPPSTPWRPCIATIPAER